MKFTGRVFVFGDDIDTDAIIPARYLNKSDPEHLKAHCMEDADPTFPEKVKPGDIIVAGKNFGCGSSREHALCYQSQRGIVRHCRVLCPDLLQERHQHWSPILEVSIKDLVGDGDTVTVDLDGELLKLAENPQSPGVSSGTHEDYASWWLDCVCKERTRGVEAVSDVKKIALIPGDGIGKEIVPVAWEVVKKQQR